MTEACGAVALQISITTTQKKKKLSTLLPRRKFLTIFKGHSSRYFPKGWKKPRRRVIISFQMITSLLKAARGSFGFRVLLPTDAASRQHVQILPGPCDPHGRGEASSLPPSSSSRHAPLLALILLRHRAEAALLSVGSP